MTTEQLRTWVVYGIAGVGIVGVLLVFAEKVLTKRAEEEKARRSAMAGKLSAAPAPTAPAPSHSSPVIGLGDSAANLQWDVPPGKPKLVMPLGIDEGLAVGLDDRGRIVVSVRVRDESGALLAEIVNNEWKVNPNGTFDRNYNANAIEVLDKSGDVVLQARLKGNRISLRAKLRAPSGAGVAIGDEVGPDGKLGGMLQRRDPGEPFEIAFVRYFKYPSELHFGEAASP